MRQPLLLCAAALAARFERLSAETVPINADGGVICVDNDDNCQLWATKGECEANPGFMKASCSASCYACQSASCRDADPSCEAWAFAGECEANEHYMLPNCAFSCRTCFVNQTAQCRRPQGTQPAVVPGTIDATFRELENGPLTPRVLSRAPWLLAFDNFLTSHEADTLIRVAGHNFEESRFLGDDKVAREGLVRNRTSTTSWCNVPSCLDDDTFQAVRQRISDLVQVPWKHSEHLQLLRCEASKSYLEQPHMPLPSAPRAPSCAPHAHPPP